MEMSIFKNSKNNIKIYNLYHIKIFYYIKTINSSNLLCNRKQNSAGFLKNDQTKTYLEKYGHHHTTNTTWQERFVTLTAGQRSDLFAQFDPALTSAMGTTINLIKLDYSTRECPALSIWYSLDLGSHYSMSHLAGFVCSCNKGRGRVT